jgi:hypothetical protein
VLHRIKRLLAAILSPMRIESAALTGTPTKIAATAAAGLTVERRSHGRLRESACVLLGNRWAPSRHENHHPLASLMLMVRRKKACLMRPKSCAEELRM